jgi:hypothetical protein
MDSGSAFIRQSPDPCETDSLPGIGEDNMTEQDARGQIMTQREVRAAGMDGDVVVSR